MMPRGNTQDIHPRAPAVAWTRSTCGCRFVPSRGRARSSQVEVDVPSSLNADGVRFLWRQENFENAFEYWALDDVRVREKLLSRTRMRYHRAVVAHKRQASGWGHTKRLPSCFSNVSSERMLCRACETASSSPDDLECYARKTNETRTMRFHWPSGTRTKPFHDDAPKKKNFEQSRINRVSSPGNPRWYTQLGATIFFLRWWSSGGRVMMENIWSKFRIRRVRS